MRGGGDTDICGGNGRMGEGFTLAALETDAQRRTERESEIGQANKYTEADRRTKRVGS